MRAYKYKLRPVSPGVERRLVETLSLCRELYNAGLQERRDAWRINRKSVSFASQSRQLPEIKLLRPDLDMVYAQVLQNVLRRLDQSFAAFFRRVKAGEQPGHPRFKGDGRYNSFTYPQDGFKLDGNGLTLSKVGRVRLRLSREIGGRVKTCTIKREADGWYVVFSVEEDRSRYFPKTGEETGLDMGLASFITSSDGSKVPNPRWSKEVGREQKRLQRALTRKQPGSARRKKARAALRHFHQRVARRRLDFFHKLALDLIRRYDTIYVEDLKVRNLVRNHHLAKAILDASWGLFISILCGKAESAGRRVVKVNPAGTSQLCSGCGERVEKDLGERTHSCPFCGLTLCRDENAARNIERRGRAGPSGMGAGWRHPGEPRILAL